MNTEQAIIYGLRKLLRRHQSRLWEEIRDAVNRNDCHITILPTSDGKTKSDPTRPHWQKS
jgi:transketolase C-terminal domain/subunit